MTVVSSTFPVASTTAILQPVRKPGSQPSTTFPVMGACIKSCFRLSEKTRMAPSSAFSVKIFRISVSIEGAIRRL